MLDYGESVFKSIKEACPGVIFCPQKGAYLDKKPELILAFSLSAWKVAVFRMNGYFFGRKKMNKPLIWNSTAENTSHYPQHLLIFR